MIFNKTECTKGGTLAALLVFLMLAMSLSACGDKTPSENAKATGDAVGDAMEATGEAVGDAAKATGSAVGGAIEATGEFLTQTREADLKIALETLERIEKEWQDLQAKSAPVGDAAKIEFLETRQQMSEALVDARARLAEAKDASADSWREDAKPALDDALQKAQGLFEDAYAKFGGK